MHPMIKWLESMKHTQTCAVGDADHPCSRGGGGGVYPRSVKVRAEGSSKEPVRLYVEDVFGEWSVTHHKTPRECADAIKALGGLAERYAVAQHSTETTPGQPPETVSRLKVRAA